MNKRDILFGLAVALIIAFFISPFACSWLDGLERVAEDKGFLERGEVKPVVSSLIPDYTWPGVKSERLATSLAGIAGTLFVFGFTYCLGAALKRKKI